MAPTVRGTLFQFAAQHTFHGSPFAEVRRLDDWLLFRKCEVCHSGVGIEKDTPAVFSNRIVQGYLRLFKPTSSEIAAATSSRSWTSGPVRYTSVPRIDCRV